MGMAGAWGGEGGKKPGKRAASWEPAAARTPTPPPQMDDPLLLVRSRPPPRWMLIYPLPPWIL